MYTKTILAFPKTLQPPPLTLVPKYVYGGQRPPKGTDRTGGNIIVKYRDNRKPGFEVFWKCHLTIGIGTIRVEQGFVFFFSKGFILMIFQN